MLHIGRARHPGPGPRNIVPGQLSIEFINVGGWLTFGDLALDSCAQFLAVAEHRLESRLEPGLLVIFYVKLVIILFGLLPVRISLLVVMLGLGLLVLVVPLYLCHHLLPLNFRSFFGWVGFYEPLFLLPKEEWFTFLSFMGIRVLKRMLRN